MGGSYETRIVVVGIGRCRRTLCVGAHGRLRRYTARLLCRDRCIDNGTNSPTTINPPVNFGFTTSPGPATGSLTIDVLVPDNEARPASFAITGTVAATATLFSATPWTSGMLDAYLGISASPNNPIGAYLPSTQA